MPQQALGLGWSGLVWAGLGWSGPDRAGLSPACSGHGLSQKRPPRPHQMHIQYLYKRLHFEHFTEVLSGAGGTRLFKNIVEALTGGGGGGAAGPPHRLPASIPQRPGQLFKKWCLAHAKRMVTSMRCRYPVFWTPKLASGAGEALALEKAVVWCTRNTAF